MAGYEVYGIMDTHGNGNILCNGYITEDGWLVWVMDGVGTVRVCRMSIPN